MRFLSTEAKAVWLESSWLDDDGTLLVWYHHEPGGLCGAESLTAPKIGAAISWDGGLTVQDLGVVLDSPFPINCQSKNDFFGGGNGDFSVVPDQKRKYFYFFFTNYGGRWKNKGLPWPAWHGTTVSNRPAASGNTTGANGVNRGWEVT